MMKKASILFVLLLVSANAQHLKASGFAIFEVGARAAALAGAFVAGVDDASAIYYNPAGIAFLKGVRAKTNLLFSKLTTTAYSQDTDFTYESSPFQLRGSHFLTWSPFDKLSLGIGGFNPYLTEMSWLQESPLCYQAQFSSYYIRPAIAVKLMNGLAVGFGIDFVFSKVDWTHTYTYFYGIYGPYDIKNRYDVKGNGMGFVIGVLWKLDKKLQFGGKYQHKVAMDLKGNNIFYTYGYPMLNLTSRITMPAEFVFGLMFTPVDRLAMHLDFQWSSWSETKGWEFQSDETAENLIPDFEEIWGDFINLSLETANQNAELKLKDTWNIKFGLEYRLSNIFVLRAGYAYHPSAVESGAIHPINPDLDRNIISFGLGVEGPLFSIWDENKVISGLSFDIYVQYVMSKAQTSSISGFGFSYDRDHLIAGFGAGLNF